MTDSSQTQTAYVKEASYGVTPATPGFKKVRTTGVPTLTPEKQFLISDEMRPDRNVPAAVSSGQNASFDLPIEFSYGSFDDLLEGFMCSTWASDVLKNGTALQSFTFENKFITSAGLRYHRITGAVVNTFSLNLTANGKAEGSFGFMGKQGTSANAAVAGATYADPDNGDFFRATDDVTIQLGGGIGAVSVMSVSLSGTNNNRLRPVVGSGFTDGIGLGRFEVTGELNAYFNNSALYDKFLADEYTSLTLTFNDPETGSYTIYFPRIKFTAGQVVAGGNNSDVMANMSWTATVDTTEDCAMKITRDPA
ncbi:phage tail tube protein [Hymenobacter fodinae]|uniref:Phage tail protein n=1 Tax=Hymenobacter fodinae TaxID=2510796 RepID=A0A4Z0P338_9BACT|nr:phage tail tube protein [Hymenobacter fodinae]TGE04628.1 phage tail protein [Hymenobacter fodinae]